MGASSSSENTLSSEQRQLESLVASTGALPMLQTTFSNLADPQSNSIHLQSLQQCFCLDYKNPSCEARDVVPESFRLLLDHLGEAIVDVFFVCEKGGISWVEFLKGYLKCCGRMPASTTLNSLLRVFSIASGKAGSPLKLEFEFGDDDDYKISGSLVAVDVLVLLWLCWTMLWDSRSSAFSGGKENLCVPDVSHLVLSAVVSCGEVGDELNLWDCDISSLEVKLAAGKLLTWAVTSVPGLSDCFTQFVHSRLQNSASSPESENPTSSPGEIPPGEASDICLLTCGRAFAISLTLRDIMRTEILKPYLPSGSGGTSENLVYRSSRHGRGLNRFWSNIEGYHGPLLVLVSATSGESQDNGTNERKWVIGALTQQGFENKDAFYGASGSLYAICPVFHTYTHSGKDKNFVYSHLQPTGRAYDAHPKPVGIAFGGTVGNERIFIEEDFAKITIRHHAADKTYQHGPLFPSQGFLAVEASIAEIEVWGLGGKAARATQSSYKKREELFIEQRRKIDLKTFANWEDSPEKMMMDMMSNPNAVRREER
ncbi:TLD-domain containing nucleolar protein [Euphorbia peplus]|nr:TLD-domain containing nucleolar protein [Euphorbia peplus]